MRLSNFLGHNVPAVWPGTAGLFLTEGQRSIPSTLSPMSTPAHQILDLSMFVLSVTGGIFVVVVGLLTLVIIKFRERKSEDCGEPAQVYGSVHVELAWTVIPVLIVVVLFLTTARLIFAIQDAPQPESAVEVTVIGHQFWWEFNYPKLGIHTANEMHVPASNPPLSSPTFMTLLSADVIHSFWVPQLAGKMDLVPNNVNHLWIDPQRAGIYLGQCAQFCGIEHAKMLLRVYVDTPEAFSAWVKNQQQKAVQDNAVASGRHIFEREACMNCHSIAGTEAAGRFGPDLTHLMSRDTLASGVVENNVANLREWTRHPDTFKEGALMPAMQLDDRELDQVTAYLSTLR